MQKELEKESKRPRVETTGESNHDEHGGQVQDREGGVTSARGIPADPEEIASAIAASAGNTVVSE